MAAVLDVWHSSGHRKTLLLTFLLSRTVSARKRFLVAQRGITNSRQLVGQCAAALLVAARLHISAQRRTHWSSRPPSSATLDARSTLLAPWVNNVREVAIPFLEMCPRCRLLPELYSWASDQNQLEVARILEVTHVTRRLPHQAVAVNKPMPGIDSAWCRPGCVWHTRPTPAPTAPCARLKRGESPPPATWRARIRSGCGCADRISQRRLIASMPVRAHHGDSDAELTAKTRSALMRGCVCHPQAADTVHAFAAPAAPPTSPLLGGCRLQRSRLQSCRVGGIGLVALRRHGCTGRKAADELMPDR